MGCGNYSSCTDKKGRDSNIFLTKADGKSIPPSAFLDCEEFCQFIFEVEKHIDYLRSLEKTCHMQWNLTRFVGREHISTLFHKESTDFWR